MIRRPPRSTLFPTRRSSDLSEARAADRRVIAIRGAREHNLKDIDVEIPRDQLVVFTGLSGSGKSSLAFDTIYAEDRKSTRLNSSHLVISYAGFCLNIKNSTP